jgi:phosphoketolase
VGDPSTHLQARQPPNIHVRGYKEEGTTTTPFDMVMLNDLDRFHLVGDVIDRYPASAIVPRGCAVKEWPDRAERSEPHSGIVDGDRWPRATFSQGGP